MGLMMFERLSILMRVASLYVNRRKVLRILNEIKASDLSREHQTYLIDIMRRMKLLRACDVQAFDSLEPSSQLAPSPSPKARRQGKG